jgi:hypothetical protein
MARLAGADATELIMGKDIGTPLHCLLDRIDLCVGRRLRRARFERPNAGESDRSRGKQARSHTICGARHFLISLSFG